jgi:hypothetical protein
MKAITYVKRNGAAFAAAILAALLVFISTLQGPGVGGDATIYLTSAKNFSQGIGLGLINPDDSFRLIPYFPPFFSLVLSLFSTLNMDMVIAVRWMNILLFCTTVFWVVKTTQELLHEWKFSLALGILLAASPVLVPAFSWVMSEPLSIFLGTLALLLLLKGLQNQEHNALLHGSAILAGLSAITRYGAVVYAATACILLLAFLSGNFRKRLGKAVVYGIEAALPLGLWAVIDLSLTSTVSSRSVQTLAGMGARLLSFLGDLKSVLLFWLLPDSWITDPFYPTWINTILLALFVIAFAAGSWFLLKKSKPVQALYQLSMVLVVFSVLYLLMTLVISILTHPPITIGTRMFSPMALMVFWLLILILYAVWKAGNHEPLITFAILVFMAIFTLWTGWRGLRIVEYDRINGLGFQSVVWQESNIVSYIQTLPDEQALVTNEEMGVLFLTGRRAYPLAEIYVDDPVDEFEPYGQLDSSDQGEIAFRQGAYLVLFDSIYDQLQGLYGNKTTERVMTLTDGLQLIYHGKDGNVFRIAATVEE